jgi:hypothetical protein
MKKLETFIDPRSEMVKTVIDKLGNKFDTHDFILTLLQTVLDTQADNDTIVQTIDAQIGRYLSKNQSVFGIKDTEERKTSHNIKGTDSENQEWEKISKK